MSEACGRSPRQVSAAKDDDAALDLAVWKATGVEVPPLKRGTPVKLAAAARARAEASEAGTAVPRGAAQATGAQPLPAPAFPAWAIIASGVGLTVVALLARIAPLASRFPGSLLALAPALNLLCNPVAAFALVQRTTVQCQ